MNIAASRAFLAVGVGAVVLATFAAFIPVLWPSALTFDALVLLIATVDLLWARKMLRHLSVSIECNHIWSRGRKENVVFLIQNHHQSTLRQIALQPDIPSYKASASPGVIVADLPGHRIHGFTFELVGHQRGPLVLVGVFVEHRSPFKMWHVSRKVSSHRDVAVHPDLKQINEYALLARADRLDRIGIRKIRKIGGENEFERLRDFQNDDPLNRIDWKATARRDQLTVRDYQTSQSQLVNLVIDHSRLMQTHVSDTHTSDQGERTMLDHAIDAGLMLAHVALHQRDRLGMVTFAERVTKRLPSYSGGRRFAELVHSLHDLEPTETLSRPDEAITFIGRHERKRSLVIIITHIINQTGADILVKHASSLALRHLPLIVLLQDPEVYAAVPQPNETFADDQSSQEQHRFWQAGAAATVAQERQVAIEQLRQAGCLVIDTPVKSLTPAVISEYLEIKARNLL